MTGNLHWGIVGKVLSRADDILAKYPDHGPDNLRDWMAGVAREGVYVRDDAEKLNPMSPAAAAIEIAAVALILAQLESATADG